MPASWGEILPSGVTAVASDMTSPAPPWAKAPRWTRCQSDGRPSIDEYWHMGDTHTRLRIVVPRSVRGEKRRLTGIQPPRETGCSAIPCGRAEGSGRDSPLGEQLVAAEGVADHPRGVEPEHHDVSP